MFGKSLLRLSALAICAGNAQAATLDDMAAKIQALQDRIETLEAQSRRDRADAISARAALKAVRRGNASAIRKFEIGKLNTTVIAADQPIFVEQPSTFAGPYAAAVAGYKFRSQKQTSNNFSTFPALAAAEGGTVGAALGYNAVAGSILIGLEGRFQKEFGSTTDRANVAYPSGGELPRLLYSSCCFTTRSPGRYPLTSIGDLGLSYGYSQKDIATREYSGDVVVRAGLIFGETLIFAKVGAGIESIRRVTTTDSSATVTCRAPTGYEEVEASGFTRGFATGCTSISTGGVVKVTTDRAQPYAIIGAGVEQNFGPYFVRAEGSILNHLPAFGNSAFGSGYYITTEITGAVGYRF